MEKRRKTLGNRENVEKHWKTGRIRGKHRKTLETRRKRRKTRENGEIFLEIDFEINISDKKSRRFDLSEVIFKCIKVL